MYLSKGQIEHESYDSIVDECIEKHGEFLIAILQDIQKRYNYIPEDAMRKLAKKLGITLRDVYGVASFYKAFSFTPKGKHVVTTCTGTACHVRGSSKIVDAFSNELGIKPGETTKDLMFTHETAACLGCCAIGPVVVVDGDYLPKVKTTAIRKIIDGTKRGAAILEEEDQRIFPIQVVCPQCNHSLMKPEHLVDNYPCIHVTISFKRKHGWLRLSSLYGSFNIESEHDIPVDTEVNFFCPHCHAELVGSSTCPECSAPMILMLVTNGGNIQICSRRGCKGHILDI
ncbi:MAG: NAD(P)H-dependent oxidoreductase subunit E [Bacteroidales bacterium]|nr:MAG: NAD(P)H-dependent oxidoreductase subunit E [Bacteroidales bacterium]